jgi:hypothetical protein
MFFTDEQEEVASGWSDEYNVFTDAELFASFLSEESMDLVFLSIVISGAVFLVGLLIAKSRKNNSSKK